MFRDVRGGKVRGLTISVPYPWKLHRTSSEIEDSIHPLPSRLTLPFSSKPSYFLSTSTPILRHVLMGSFCPVTLFVAALHFAVCWCCFRPAPQESCVHPVQLRWLHHPVGCLLLYIAVAQSRLMTVFPGLGSLINTKNTHRWESLRTYHFPGPFERVNECHRVFKLLDSPVNRCGLIHLSPPSNGDQR